MEKYQKWRIPGLLRETIYKMIHCTFEDGKPAIKGLRHAVVDIIVLDGDKILLVKRAAHLTNGGKYAIIGGFVDRDETTMMASVREVKEETGYACTPYLLLRIADNPNRPKEDRQNVSFVYVARVGEKVGERDNEASEVTWFDLHNLPEKESFAFDHYENIQLYLQYQKQKFATPVIGEIL